MSMSGRRTVIIIVSFAKKEIECGPLHGDTVGMPDGPVVGILNRPVALDMTDSPVIGILYGPIILDMSDRPVTIVLDCAIAFQMTDRSVVAVLDGSVRLDVPDGAVITVLYGPVGLDMGDGLVAAVFNTLGIEVSRKEAAKNQPEDDKKCPSHSYSFSVLYSL
jgi:hypothetical protein